VGSSESVAAAAQVLGLCNVLCWLLLTVDNTDRVALTATHWPTNSHWTPVPGVYRVTKAEPVNHRATGPMVTIQLHWCHINS